MSDSRDHHEAGMQGRRVLCVNDDGVGSAGLHALASVLSAWGCDVRVCAPAGNQSGVSHRVTLGGALRASRWAPAGVLRPGADAARVSAAWAVAGTPVDCVRAAFFLNGQWRPELILSGVNDGNNLGMCAMYSGTIAAALEGAVMGVPSVALSLDVFSPTESDMDALCASLHRLQPLFCRVLQHGVPRWGALAVNLPREPFKGLALARAAMAPLSCSYELRGAHGCDAAGVPEGCEAELAIKNVRIDGREALATEGTDLWLVQVEGYASVCPIWAMPEGADPLWFGQLAQWKDLWSWVSSP
eukprot:m51a1_g14397 5'-nucleotidase, putative (301) ;mRNA; f:348584-349754